MLEYFSQRVKASLIFYEKHTLSFLADDFKCDFLDEKNEAVKSFRGYVPEFMYLGENEFEDYTMLNINGESVPLKAE